MHWGCFSSAGTRKFALAVYVVHSIDRRLFYLCVCPVQHRDRYVFVFQQQFAAFATHSLFCIIQLSAKILSRFSELMNKKRHRAFNFVAFLLANTLMVLYGQISFRIFPIASEALEQ